MPAWQHLDWRRQKSEQRIWRRLCGLLYHDRYTDLERTILVAGTARSGTTWLGEIIASQVEGRIVFEPFNPGRVKQYQQFRYQQYQRPEEDNATLEDYCRRVFRGQIRHRWLDREVTRLLPKYRVVKAVRANLFLEWLAHRFPGVPRVLIIRHPCAVALSWLQLGWTAEKDIDAFLQQQKLMDDFLSDKIDSFSWVHSEEEKIALVWCVTNLVPLRQGSKGNVHVVSFEHMVTQPRQELPRLFAAIGHKFNDSIYAHLMKPSATTQQESVATTYREKTVEWQRQLSSKQIDRILGIVGLFGLEHIYDDDPFPRMEWRSQSVVER